MRVIGLALCAALLSTGGVAAQDGLSGAPGLAEYQAYAEAHNPGLDAARARSRAAREGVPQARALPDPQLTYRFDQMGGFSTWGHQVEISQPLPWFGKRRLAGERAGLEAEQADEMYRGEVLALNEEIAQVYVDYYYLARELIVTRENLKLLASLVSVAQANYAAGKGSQSDVVRTQVEMGILEERIQSLTDLTRPSAARLAALLGAPPGYEPPLPSAIPEPVLAASEEQLLRMQKEHNPSLRVLELAVETDARAVSLARKRSYPDFMLGIGAGNAPDPFARSMDFRRSTVMGMLSLNLPIQGGANRAAVDEARETKRAGEQALADRELQLTAELEAALYRFRDAGRKESLYRDSLLPAARQSLTVARRSYEAGEATFFEVIDAQRVLLELELSFERARADRAAGYAALNRLVGTELSTAD